MGLAALLALASVTVLVATHFAPGGVAARRAHHDQNVLLAALNQLDSGLPFTGVYAACPTIGDSCADVSASAQAALSPDRSAVCPSVVSVIRAIPVTSWTEPTADPGGTPVTNLGAACDSALNAGTDFRVHGDLRTGLVDVLDGHAVVHVTNGHIKVTYTARAASN